MYFAFEIITDTKTNFASIVKTVQRFRNMLHLSQIALFLSVNEQRWSWNCSRYRLSTKGQLQNMLMNFQNQSILPPFCSTHLRVQAEGYTAQQNSVKYVAQTVM